MRIRLFFQKTWFLGLLCIMCFVGYVGHSWVEKLMSVYPPKAHIFALMFLMSFSLRADSLRKGITSYKLHAAMFFINYILATAIAVMLAFIFFRNNEGLFVGLLIVAAVPSTMASATVWTRLANGNDGISMSFTFISNISTFIVSPTLLAAALFVSGICVTTPEGGHVSLFKCFPFMRTLYDLAIAVIIPVVIGQAVRLALPRLAEKSKKTVTIVSQLLVLFMIFIAVGKAQPKMARTPGGILFLTLLVVPFLHVILLGVCYFFARIFRLKYEELPPFLFSGSQKTLPIGFLLATGTFTALPLAALGIVIYHPTQLVIDLFVVEFLNARKKAGDNAGLEKDTPRIE